MGDAQALGAPAAIYYGTALSPRWPKGAGWVLGRSASEFIAQNAEDLRMHGMPDLLMGFWLAPLEDLHYLDLPEHQLILVQDTVDFSNCSSEWLVADGMTEEAWSQL